jgi:hypothetical protein
MPAAPMRINLSSLLLPYKCATQRMFNNGTQLSTHTSSSGFYLLVITVSAAIFATSISTAYLKNNPS